MNTRLHPITWVIVAAAGLHLLGDIGELGNNIRSLQQHSVLDSTEAGWMNLFFIQAHRMALTISYVGTAATVEFLIRIWSELKAQLRG